jgi:hypothetical protein
MDEGDRLTAKINRFSEEKYGNLRGVSILISVSKSVNPERHGSQLTRVNEDFAIQKGSDSSAKLQNGHTYEDYKIAYENAESVCGCYVEDFEDVDNFF